MHQDDSDAPRIGQPDYSALEGGQIARLTDFKSARDAGAVRSALAAIGTVAGGDHNLMPPLIDAVKVGVTLGEISDQLRREWGTYDG